jgi:tetratricopeptide (TPR) repeat protein
MRHLLKAIGFWIWGLLAIGLAASVANIGYRWAGHFHSVDQPETAPRNGVSLQIGPARTSLSASPSAASAQSVPLTGALPTGSRARLELAEHNQDVNGEIYYGQELYYQREASTDDLVQLVSRITLAKGCEVGLVWANRALEFEERVRRTPSAELYSAKSGCVKDRGEAIATAVELIKLTDDPKWWRHWIELNVQGQNDWVALAYLRVGNLVGALSPALTADYATLLDRLKLYGEGHRFVQRTTKALSADHSEGAEFLKEDLALSDGIFVRGASADAEKRNQLLDSPRLGPEVLARIGALSYEAGNFESAIGELTTALPGIPKAPMGTRIDPSSANHPEDSYVYLALSQLELNRKEAALKTFSALLNLYLYAPWRDAWQIYIEQKLATSVLLKPGA